jgi:hypothetical protein
MIKRFLSIGMITTAFLTSFAGSASAAVVWRVASTSNSTVAAGGQLEDFVQISNVGDEGATSDPITVTATFPLGMTVASAPSFFAGLSCTTSAQTVTCVGSAPFFQPNTSLPIEIVVNVEAGASGVLVPAFEVTGGGAPEAAQTVDPVQVSAEEPAFGLDTFDTLVADRSEEPLTLAARHPYAVSTSIDFNSHTDSAAGPRYPVEDVKDVTVDLPPGSVGGAGGISKCSLAELANGESATDPRPLCPTSSQVGVMKIRMDRGETAFFPLFNLLPPPGVAARFGANVAGDLVTLNGSAVRTDGKAHVRIASENTLQALALSGTTVVFWGVPSDPSHDAERACPGERPPTVPHGVSCLSDSPAKAFFRTPTSCSSDGLATSVSINSWQNPSDLKKATTVSHEPPGYPYPSFMWGPQVGNYRCDQVPFDPNVAIQTTTQSADSPTGLSVDISIPSECWEPMSTAEQVEAAICQSDMKAAVVSLPVGLTLNPAAATGRVGCSPAQIGLTTPIGQEEPEFDEAPVACPDASKLGKVTITTPLLDEPLQGEVYLGQQGRNPFRSLLAMYLVAEGAGVNIKQAGDISLDPLTGRVTTSFDETPQLPFSNLHLELFGGSRAALRTPAVCGTYAAEGSLTPWSGNGAVLRSSSFEVTQGCGDGFAPKLRAGTENALAGSDSPFSFQITRDDGTQEFGGLQVKLPPGLVGSLRGYSYCPDDVLAGISTGLETGRTQESSPSCPASSLVGSATIGAGAGSEPFYTASGRAYLAGPYRGAPISLAVVAPAVAGPFDLGSVVVRNAIHIAPTTAGLTIESDPLPTIIHGIALDLRDVRVRYNHTVNPTSCEPMQINAAITSIQGAVATPAVHFQAGNCDRLGFKPRLSLRLSGPTHRAAHPGLRAVLRARAGDANIARSTVLLPKTELLENAHIREVCTRVQYVAGKGGGAGCPNGAIYGYARAWTPLLDQPLQGPVYLRSNGGDRELPDLVASLDGQIHVDLVGYIDSVHARIRNRFAAVPDTPVTRFELIMPGGRKGLLANDTNLCRAKPRATAIFGGQNGASQTVRPLLKAKCKKGARTR